jgi:hypothetical protein
LDSLTLAGRPRMNWSARFFQQLRQLGNIRRNPPRFEGISP